MWAAAVCASEAKNVRVVIRYDDYSSISSSDADRGLIEILRKYNISAVFSVVPFTHPDYQFTSNVRIPLNGEKIALLRSAKRQGLVEVALHGSAHVNRVPGTTAATKCSEFAGVPQEEQVQVIREAAAELKAKTGVKPTTFVPPWDNYDSSTLTAVSECGMRIMSGSKSGIAGGGIKFLPVTTDVTRFESDVRRSRESAGPGAIVVLLLHPEDFRESGKPAATTTLPAFDAVIGRLTQDGEITFTTFAELLASGEDLSPARFKANKDVAAMVWSLPDWLRPEVPWGTYLPFKSASSLADNARNRRSAVLVGFIFVGLLSGLAIRRTLRSPYSTHLTSAVILLSVGVAFAAAFKRGGFHNREAVLLCFAGGLLAYVVTLAVYVVSRKNASVAVLVSGVDELKPNRS